MSVNSLLTPAKRLVPKPVKRRVKKILGLDKPVIYFPTFDKDALTRAVQRYAASQSESAESTDIAAGGAAGITSCDDAVAYFRERTRPAFFADGPTLRRLADTMTSQHPEWRDRLLALTSAEATEALQLYAVKAPPLRPGFPWCAIHEGSHGDDLYTSRAHRFPFAARNGLAILYGQASPAAFADLLEDWMTTTSSKGCFYAYESLSIVFQRIVALGWAHAFVAAAPDATSADSVRLQTDILLILHADMQFLSPRIGTSYPNGHLLGDLYAGWYLALLLPEFMPATANLDVNESAWLAELERQIYPDGTGFEHAVKYHQGICQMVAVYVILNRRNARPIPLAILQRIERMLAFQVGLAGPHGDNWFIGDGIEMDAFTLDTSTGWPTASIREMYRALFRPDLEPASPSDPAIERAFWRLGGALAPSSDVPEPKVDEYATRYWPDGGIGVFPDAMRDARLIFRTGPAEHRDTMAGHMHADLLSICVSHGTQPVLIDPGTYSYRFGNEHIIPGRAYFTGPAAHNGLCLDRVNPLGEVVGDFRQGGSRVHVVTRMQQFASALSWLESELRGDSIYRGHRRGVVHVNGEYWVVYDCLPPGAVDVKATMGFQAAPDVRAALDDDGTVRFETSAGTLWLARSPVLGRAEITSGQHHPDSGWVSPTYGELVAAPQLRCSVDRGAQVTAFVLGTGAAPVRPVSVRTLRTGIAIQLEGPAHHDLLLLATHAERIKIEVASKPVGDARAVWLRSESGQPSALKCLDFQAAESQPPRGGAMFPRCGHTSSAPREFQRDELDTLSVPFSGTIWT